MSSNVVDYLKKNDSHAPFENGSASCYICNGGIDSVDNIGLLIGLRKMDIKNDLTPVQYSCGKILCMAGALKYSKEPKK